MAATSHRHQNKKPFQPPPNHITNYFSTTEQSPFPRSNTTAQPKEVAPSLTPAIQASLLSVGMRIRKAVPEGYKTHKTQAPAPAPDFADADFLATNISGPDNDDGGAPRSQVLTPFCGIHNVGGLATQQESWVRQMSGFAYGASARPPVGVYAGGGGGFVSSQESAVSAEDGARLGGGLLRNKRRLDDDFDYEDDDEDNGGEEETQWLEHQNSYAAVNRRIFAKPIRRGTGPGSRRLQHGGAVQSALLRQTSNVGIDFEEAGFLQPWDDGEIEMGGT